MVVVSNNFGLVLFVFGIVVVCVCSLIELPRFSWILIVHDVWMLNCLDVVESWRD